MKCKLLIVGTPRHGGNYVNRLLMDAGVKTRHEKYGVDVTVSPVLVVDDYYYPYHNTIKIDGEIRTPKRSEIEWDHIFHQIRDPLEVISSHCFNLGDTFWRWQEKHTGIAGDMKPVESKAMKFWVQWNHMASNLAELTYRVEDMETVFPEIICPAVGAIPRDSVERVPKHSTKKNKAHRYTWDELIEIDASAARTCQFYARHWGYQTR